MADPSPHLSSYSVNSSSKQHTHVTTKPKLISTIFGWPEALHYHGSVIPNVAIPVLLVTLWAFGVFLIGNYGFVQVAKISIPATFISIISLVLSLLLVFRTNSAYERWNDGRKLWGTLIVLARNFVRIVWISVEETSITDTREKLAALQLVLGMLVSTRNHLRAEYGLKDEFGHWRVELVSLIPRMKALHSTTPIVGQSTMPSSSRSRSTSPNANMRNRTVAQTTDERIEIEDTHLTAGVDVDDIQELMPTNIPIDISHLLTTYILSQRRAAKLEVPQFGVLTQLISGMVDTVTNLERILTSPIPIAYTVHLKQALYVYLLMLPFQLLQIFFGWTILIVFLASFTLLGVECIGREIENPFGYDLNDLPCDQFVSDFKDELSALLTSHQIDLASLDLNCMLSDPPIRSTSTKRLFRASSINAHKRLSGSSADLLNRSQASPGLFTQSPRNTN